MKRITHSFVIKFILEIGISLILAFAFTMLTGRNVETMSTALCVLGVLHIAFSIFFGWGHSLIGRFVPNLGAMDVQHTDPSMDGMLDFTGMITGTIDILFAITLLYM